MKNNIQTSYALLCLLALTTVLAACTAGGGQPQDDVRYKTDPTVTEGPTPAEKMELENPDAEREILGDGRPKEEVEIAAGNECFAIRYEDESCQCDGILELREDESTADSLAYLCVETSFGCTARVQTFCTPTHDNASTQ